MRFSYINYLHNEVRPNTEILPRIVLLKVSPLILFARLRASRILMISMKGLGAEICKNLILAGVKSVTMLDHEAVTEDDFVSQFLVAQEQYGKNVRNSRCS